MDNQDDAIALLRGAFGQEILKNTAAYVAPIFWMIPESSGLSVKGNGSLFFLRPGHESFAVTANHVFQAYVAEKTSIPNLTCQIGKIVFNPEERLIDASEELDIATFHISPEEVRELNKCELTR